MRVLGLDLSTKPGFAVLDDGARVVAYGTKFDLIPLFASSSPVQHLEDYRFVEIGNLVAWMIDSLIGTHQPDLLVIEQTNQGRSRTVQKELEFIHCCVLQTPRVLNMARFGKVLYLDSSRWRSLCGQKLSKEQRIHNKAVKGKILKGKVTAKHLAVQWANQRFGLDLIMKDEDAADAIGIAYAGWRQQQIQNVGKIDVDKIFNPSGEKGDDQA